MSSFRRSHSSSRPAIYDYDIRFENRNSEDVHREALAAAYAEHQRIQEAAVRVARLEEARLQQLRLQQQAIQEEERVRLEEARVREETRLRELENRAKQIPKISPKTPVPPQSPPLPTKQTQPAAVPVTQPAPVPANPPAQYTNQPPATQLRTSQPLNPFQTATTVQSIPPQSANSFAQPTPKPPNPFTQAVAQHPNPFTQQAAPAPSIPQQPSSSPPPILPSALVKSPPYLLANVHKYVEIHQKLKELRKFVKSAGEADARIRKTMGELRRTLRMAVGQIVKDKSKNKDTVNKIFGVLQQAITTVSSPGVDPSMFMVKKPDPAEGAFHNGEQLPMLFIFLLNFFAKCVVAQFINEAGVNPDIADPIGVIAVQVFSRAEFLWRGESLIDIMMAKFRVACPVLWGVRGNEATDQGRAKVGWIRDKESGTYLEEEPHGSRMTGLAAGYAAICLRDFSKSRLKNPWHPTHYWQSIAAIVATPPQERSSTQYLVLRGLIDGYQATFLKFYGNAARASLVIALVKFPAGAMDPNSAVSESHSSVKGLKVLADKLKRDRGIDLRA